MTFKFLFVHSISNEDGVTFHFPWRCIKRLKMNWGGENKMERQLICWDCRFISDFIYGVHGQTSQPRDCPTPVEFMGIHLIHEIAQMWLICRHTSHLRDCPVLYEILFNIVKKLNSWYCLLCVYNTIIAYFGIVLWIAKIIQIRIFPKGNIKTRVNLPR